MAITLSTITNFFSGESKLIERGENALKSNTLLSFTYDGTCGVIKTAVQPSMKKGSYTVTVSGFAFGLNDVLLVAAIKFILCAYCQKHGILSSH